MDKHDYTIGAWGDDWAVFDFGLPIATFPTKREARYHLAALWTA